MRKISILLFFVLNMLLNDMFAQQERSSSNSSALIPSSMSISVTIGGAFIVNGTFPAMPGERVDQFVTRIFNEAKETMFKTKDENTTEQMINKKIESFARRKIILKRLVGDEILLDLEEFRMTGDFKNNPYLKNDDVLIFPAYDIKRNFFTVEGAVNSPGRFQFVDGDKLSKAILLAGGVNEAYENVSKVSISSLSYDGSKMNTRTVSISDDVMLHRGDRIIIVADETQKKEFSVRIEGEVMRPGVYPITPNSTTLHEVMNMAGGFRNNADLNRAELIRGANAFKSAVFTEEFEALMMNRMAEISAEDSSSFIVDNKLRFARGNGTIDFEKLSDTSSQASKFIVRDDDYIYVPERINLVYIFGQVNKPGYIQYKNGEGYSYYINKAGGRGITAKDEVYIIKGITRSWVKIDDKTNVIIEPGDYIWLPKKMPRTFEYYMDRAVTASSIVGTIATVILLIVQITK